MRAQHPEWSWLDPIFDEIGAQGADLELLRKDLEQRKSTMRWLKGLVGGSLGTALFAIAVALHSWGKKDGLAEAAAAQAAEYRSKVLELERSDRAQALDIARLQALSVAPRTRTWDGPPTRRTTVPDIDPNGDQGP